MNKAEAIFIGIALAVIFGLLLFFYQGKKDCDAAGGVYLRGFLGYECVQIK